MMKTVTRMLAATAALGMAFAPIAAQANTRAGDNGTVYSVSKPGLGRDGDGEAFVAFAPLLIAGFVVAAAVAAVATAASQESNDDGQSPGS
jgi:hypothetical protein